MSRGDIPEYWNHAHGGDREVYTVIVSLEQFLLLLCLDLVKMVEQVHHFHALTCKSLRVTLESIASNLRAALTITATPAGATRSQIFPLLLLLMFLLIICEKIVLVLLGCFTSVRVVDAAAHGVSIGGHLNTFGSFSSAFVHDGESRGLFAI